MWLLIAFIAVPLIEIALFIRIGGAIGLWPTLGIVVVTAIIGSYLVRSQGARELQNLRSSFSELRDPSESIVGFSLLIPPVRAAVYRYFKSRMNVQAFQMGPQPTQDFRQQPGDRVIDGEFEEIDPTHRPPQGPSGWTKH